MAARDEHFTPGFTTSSQAELITNALLTQGRMQQEMDTGDPSTASRSLLPVKLTGRSSVTGLYSWTEQTFDSTGARTDRPGGRSGTTTVSPVRLLGDAVLTTFPAEAWVVRCITTASGGIMYEGIAVGLDAFEVIDLDYVAKICVTRHSGVVTNITAEHRKIRVLGVLLPDETYCTDGDDDCCPTSTPCIETLCGDGATWPSTLILTVCNSGGIDGSYALSYDSNILYPGSWVGECDCQTTIWGQPIDDRYIFVLDCMYPTPRLRVYCNNGDLVYSSFALDVDCETTTFSGPNPDSWGAGSWGYGSIAHTAMCGWCPPYSDTSAPWFDWTVSTDAVSCGSGSGGVCLCAPCPGVDQWYLTGESAALACVDTTGWPGWESFDCLYAQAGFGGWLLTHNVTSGYWQLTNMGGTEIFSMSDSLFSCSGPNEFDIGFTVTLTP